MNEVKFTEKDLQLRAGNKIFLQGKQYYEEGKILNIRKLEDVYIAEVIGSEKYEVKFYPATNEFVCSCPYDGFCKHSVALGLALLDKGKSQNDLSEEADLLINKLTKEDLKIFAKQVIDIYPDFLEKLKILAYSRNNSQPKKAPLVNIEAVARNFSKSFDVALDFEEDYWEYGYDYPYDLVYEQASDIAKKYFKKLSNYISNGLLSDALRYYLGVLLGLHFLEIELGNDYTEILETIVDDFNYYSVPKLLNSFSSDELLNTFVGLYQPYKKDIPLVDVKYLIKESTNTETAPNVIEFMQDIDSGWAKDEILFEAYKQLNDNDSLKEIARRYPNNTYFQAEAAKIYFHENDLSGLEQTLVNLKESNDLCELKHLLVSKILSLGSYKDILQQLVYRCGFYEAYVVLKQIFTEQELRMFLHGLMSNYYSDDYKTAIKILLEEKAYDVIFKYAEDQIGSTWGIDVTDLLNELETILPEKVWTIYKQQAMFLYNLKKRSTYAAMSKYLKRMKKLKAKETKELISNLYNSKPIRPAFREEMERAGLV